MNTYLTRKIWELRKNTTTLPGTPYVFLEHVANKVYQLLFTSCGCNNACTFCNYGFDYNLTLEMVKPELEKIDLSKYDIGMLELEANGSFLSEREIPYDLFLEILRYVAHKGIPIIMMETHYMTITEQKLKDIRRILGPEQEIHFELGLESVNQRVLGFYNKDIDLEKYLETARLCEKYGITLQINVLLGAPFFNREEQIQDCLNTLDFIYNKMPQGTLAVLFPINIKKDTMLEYWQKKGLYKQISSWEFVELLHRIPEEYLGKFAIAWWGERENPYTPDAIQFPLTCSKCHDRLMAFYRDFYCHDEPEYRKKILDKIWNSRCECDG